jgi:putative Holliday junction resolvase
MAEPGVVVALDYGRRRIGVAACDPLGITTAGVATLDGRDVVAVLDAVAAIVEEREAAAVVVGLPLNMDGSSGPMATAATKFAEAVRARVRVPVELMDERLTSFAADQVLREAGMSRKERAEKEDQVAAAIILRAYLDRRSGNDS